MGHPLSHSVKWVLSPMYDVNPDIFGEYLSLNVDTDNSKIDLNLAIEASKYYGISRSETERMSLAFSRL